MQRKLLLLFIIIAPLSLLLLSAARSTENDVNENKTEKSSYQYCAPAFDPDVAGKDGAILIKGMGTLHYPVTTASPKAQQFFDQGLTLVYAFNHGEALRSFKEAVKLDEKCAMAYWGIAMVLGPNYNASLDPSKLNDINNAISNAQRYAVATTEKEQGLVAALAQHFPKTETKDMAPYNAAYVAAMKGLYEKYPADVEIATLYADAMMNEHPWDLWEKNGNARPWTPALRKVLEETIKANPNHPGAIHFYLHTMEASREAAAALPVADKLGSILPAAGHIVHMPSHIYIRTGHYHKGVLVNERASVADSSYLQQCKVNKIAPFLYYQHNIHFLAACAFLEGNSKKAMAAAWNVASKSRKEFIQSATVQHYSNIPFYVMVHLGRWNEILNTPRPTDGYLYREAIWHYSQGMALANTGKINEAEKEMALVQQYAMNAALKEQRIWDMNSVQDLVRIAALTLGSEIAMKQGRYEHSIALLQEALVIEDQLNYTEPPDWFFSVRHSLGRVLVMDKKYKEAEAVYEADMLNLPENGWALMGLYQSLRGQGKMKEAEDVMQRFKKAWQWADMEISASRVD